MGHEAFSGSRWELIRTLIGPDTGSVLDVGCRDKELRNHLPPDCGYVGVDLFPPADVIASAEEPLPFEDHRFSAVVLADVLEHLNDPHAALDEAMRVSSSSVVVVLPNMYTIVRRLLYLAGRTAGKYEFGPASSQDRHRWVMNFDQAASFACGRAELAGWRVGRECGHLYGFRRPGVRGAYRLARWARRPNLWAWAYAARLERAP